MSCEYFDNFNHREKLRRSLQRYHLVFSAKTHLTQVLCGEINNKY